MMMFVLYVTATAENGETTIGLTTNQQQTTTTDNSPLYSTVNTVTNAQTTG